ncbi:BASS family bile acid:Na+ symporter [Allocatelliglobosispora scoriae]|uniref:BASS family bile acid:Na+ symporter n=1 Tax=Allocatelliglobosispora scoriae TaxID=643052 RepID=A0A841BVY4_9ACTN|nr:bile acid:sodium symporter family protein [Allocatelliglobosispora scoriae]MBB5871319.1 BASS family bile acid:Na+ symporter [Allocatelliglobosispora scoriae]
MNSALTLVFLPVALGIIMLGLGLGLTVDDFRRVVLYPKAVLIALGCQLLLLPALCFGLVILLDLPPALAVGMMVLAASPGGTTANLYSHLFGGHVALNVTLTAINSVLAVVTLPVVVNFAIANFMSGNDSIGLQFDKVAQVFAIVLVPVAIGMLIRAKAPAFADRMQRPVKILSIVVLVAVIAGAVLKEKEHIADYFVAVGVAALIFNVISLSVGYWLPRLATVERTQSIAAAFEIGIHNSTLAITIAISPALLDSTEMAIPAAVYGLIMFFTAAVFGLLIRRRPATPPAEPA